MMISWCGCASVFGERDCPGRDNAVPTSLSVYVYWFVIPWGGLGACAGGWMVGLFLTCFGGGPAAMSSGKGPDELMKSPKMMQLTEKLMSDPAILQVRSVLGWQGLGRPQTDRYGLLMYIWETDTEVEKGREREVTREKSEGKGRGGCGGEGHRAHYRMKSSVFLMASASSSLISPPPPPLPLLQILPLPPRLAPSPRRSLSPPVF